MNLLDPDSLMMALPDEPMAPGLADGALVMEQPDGSVMVDFDGGGDDSPSLANLPFNGNLASAMAQADLSEIGERVIQWVDADLQSRGEWEERLRDGMEVLGIAPRKSVKSPLKNGSVVTHPLVTEAAIQFASRAIEELQPSDGPAKCVRVPDASDEIEKQSDRVENYLNFYLTEEDEDYQDDFDKMLFICSLHGDAFRKVWKDPDTRKPISRFVEAEHLIVPYSAKNLKSAPRITHRMYRDANEVLRDMEVGLYVTVDITSPGIVDTTTSKQLSDEIDARQPAQALDDNERTLYECHCLLRIKGLDDESPMSPARPYIVTVDVDTRQVLAIYRNWRENDARYRKRVWFVQYPFLRGMGFYNLGFFHVLGQLGAAAGGLLRAIIDGAALSGLNGGFKPKMPGRQSTDLTIEAGVWKDVDMPPDLLAKAFYTPPFKEPGPALFNTLNLIVEAGRRLATTTEASVGDAKNTGPVGTTIALIDEARKVFSAVHKRMHRALRRELRMIAEMLGEEPGLQYPYEVSGASDTAFSEDFSARVDVIPVSDPSISSSTQRIATAQMAVELTNSAPDIYDIKARREAHRRLLQAAKVPRPDDLIPDDADGPRLDPASENMLLMNGRPVRAFPDQAHEAHMAVHMSFLQTLPPEGAQLQPVILAHIAEHYGYNYRNKVAAILQQQGIQMPAMDLTQQIKDMPPEIEQAIAVAQMQAAEMLMQEEMARQAMMAAQAGPPPTDPKLEAEAEGSRRKQDMADEAAQREQKRKDEAFAAEQRRKDAAAGAQLVQQAKGGGK